MSRACWSAMLLAGAALAPSPARASCCEFRKIADGISQTRVRACDPAEPDSCTTWLFDQVVASGAPAEICVEGDSLVYQEWNEAAESWNPKTQAVCADGGTVDL